MPFLTNKVFIFFFNWEVVVKKCIDSYSKNSWKLVVNSLLGDAVVHVERRAGRVHIFLHSFSENEISAKEVRSRILEVSSNEETSEGEEGSFCTIYSPISATANSTLNRSGKTVYHSAIEDDDEDQIMPKVPFTYYVSTLIAQNLIWLPTLHFDKIFILQFEIFST